MIKDVFLLIAELVSPIDQIRLSACNKRFNEWLKGFINIDFWKFQEPNQGLRNSIIHQHFDLSKLFISWGATVNHACIDLACKEIDNDNLHIVHFLIDEYNNKCHHNISIK